MMMMTLVSVGDFFRMWIYIYIYSTVAAAAGSSRHTIHSPSTFSSQLYHTHIKDIEHYPKHEILPSPSSSSRYDPREIVRIHDITDLVDDEHEHNNNISNSDDEDDEEINAPPRHNSLHAGIKSIDAYSIAKDDFAQKIALGFLPNLLISLYYKK